MDVVSPRRTRVWSRMPERHTMHAATRLVGPTSGPRTQVFATTSQPSATPQAAARPDTVLLLTVLAMLVLGLLMVQSASEFTDPLDPTAFARKDALWMALGGVALVITARTDYHVWRRVARPSIIVATVLMAVVLRLGTSVGGAQRWISLGSQISFQPSEIAKLVFILFAADHLTHRRAPWSPRRFIPVAVVAALLLGLVLLQNDLGTTIILGACAFVVCVMAGAPTLPLLASSLGALGLGTVAIAATPFRRARITAFLHPLRCGSGTSYHICQSLISIGSGGLFGRGLGDGLQKAGYLPAPFTDSIFAVIGEELGFWGALLVLTLIALLLWRGLRASHRAPDAMGTLLAAGITCWLVVQALLNIGSSVAALPFTGVPLPFISFGGSSLVVSLAAVGVLLNIAAQGGEHATPGH